MTKLLIALAAVTAIAAANVTSALAAGGVIWGT